MRLLNHLVWFWRNRFRRAQVECDLDDEIRSYIDLLTEENVRAGMDPQVARREAVLDAGGAEQLKEEVRGVRVGSFADTLLQDLRYGSSSLLAQPGFSVVAILTLAIAIGANTAIFSFVDGALLKPLPYKDPESLVMIWEKPPGTDRNTISTLDFLDWRTQNTVLRDLSAMSESGFTLTGKAEPQLFSATLVSASFFEMMGTQAVLGRTFAPDEDQPGKEQVVVLTNRAWQNRFGADRGIVGQQLTLNNKPYTVIGVLPAGIYDRIFGEIWSPLAFTPDRMTRDFHWFRAFARLKPGVTIEQARAQMEGIAGRIAAAYPDVKKGWSVTLDRFQDRVVGDQTRQSLYVLLAAVCGVLLIGCANLANLMLARNTGRAREVALRSALGASKPRIIRQLMTESLLVSSVGALGGIGLGYALMRAIQVVMPLYMLPAEANIALDGRVLVFTAVISVMAGTLFGIAPALQATKGDTTGVLKDGGRGSTTGLAGQRLRSTLIVSEIALAFVLLTAAGLLMRSFTRLLDVNPGFETVNTITMQLPRSGEGVDGTQLASNLNNILEEVRTVAGVRDVAWTTSLPLQGWGMGMPFRVEGREPRPKSELDACFFKVISPSYFRTIGMRLKSGRALSDSDIAGGPPVVVINQTMADRFFKNQDPLGQRILIQQIDPTKPQLGPEIPWEIVGVVADEKVNSLDGASPGVYVANPQSPVPFGSLIVRGEGDPSVLSTSIQSAVWRADKNQPLGEIRSLEQIKSESVGSDRLRAGLLGVFAAIALTLAVVGVYGVMSYSVAQRTHEMGIRAALGADARQLMRLVVGNGMTVALVGLGLGSLGALWLTRYLASLLFNTSPTDVPIMLLVAGVLGAAALLACCVPALRATRVNPVVALRNN